MSAPPELASRLPQVARRALLLGFSGLVLAVLLALIGVGGFWRGYLFAVLLCLGLGLGGAAILMIHYLTGGRWGWCVLRPLEALASTVPVLALLAVPIVFGLESLYPWLGPDPYPAVRAKAAYLNRPDFLVRAVIYLVVWCALALVFARRSRSGDRDVTGTRPTGLIRLAAAGLIVHVLTVGFAAIDWIASLEPRWYSSIFAFNVVTAQALGAMALLVAIACSAALALEARTEGVRERLNDLGNMLLMLVAFDAYLAFAQILIVWSGNLPHHVIWYLPRVHGFWGAAAVAMIVLQLALPLFLLLFRAIKREPRRLLAVAAIVLVGRVIDVAWFVLPGAERSAVGDLVIAAAAGIGIAGLWAAVFAWQCGRRLAPVGVAR